MSGEQILLTLILTQFLDALNTNISMDFFYKKLGDLTIF